MRTTGLAVGAAVTPWSDKDERQYEQIKKRATKRGKSTKRAKESPHAPSTRSGAKKAGRRTRRAKGSGTPNSGLESRSVTELRNRASDLNIEGRSKMNKDDLIKAIRKRS